MMFPNTNYTIVLPLSLNSIEWVSNADSSIMTKNGLSLHNFLVGCRYVLGFLISSTLFPIFREKFDSLMSLALILFHTHTEQDYL